MSLFSRLIEELITPDIPLGIGRSLPEALLLESARDEVAIRDLIAEKSQTTKASKTEAAENLVIDANAIKNLDPENLWLGPV